MPGLAISMLKYTVAILSNSNRKLLQFEITKMLIAVKKITKFVVLFIIISGTLSYVSGSATADAMQPKHLPVMEVLGLVRKSLLPSLTLASQLRYDMRRYFNVCSKADMTQLNLPH